MASSDFGVLKAKAGEVERHRYLLPSPSHFEVAMEGLRSFTQLATKWEKLDEPHRDLLRHLAHALSPRKLPWWKRQRSAFQFVIFVSRHGIDEAYRQAHAFMDACLQFQSLIFEFEERQNEELQGAVADAVTSARNGSSRTPLSREQVGDWIKRLPS